MQGQGQGQGLDLQGLTRILHITRRTMSKTIITYNQSAFKKHVQQTLTYLHSREFDRKA